MSTDSREARIEAEAVTEDEERAAVTAFRLCFHDRLDEFSERDLLAGMRAALDAARKARALNGSGEAKHARFCSAAGPLPCHICGDGEPAPDRVSRIEAALGLLFAGVGLAPDGMDSAWIAAKKLWEGE